MTDYNLFEELILINDSTALTLKIEEGGITKTNKGDIRLIFKTIGKLCTKEDCKNCDFPDGIFLSLGKDADSVNLPRFLLGQCPNNPRIYPIGKCNDKYATSDSWSLRYGNLIFFIRELRPYPETKAKLAENLKNKDFEIDLQILNVCM